MQVALIIIKLEISEKVTLNLIVPHVFHPSYKTYLEEILLW